MRFIHRSEENSAKRLYWDGGPKKIELFMAHHLKECENNPICYSLHLLTIEFEDEGEDKNFNLKPLSPLQKHKKKTCLLRKTTRTLYTLTRQKPAVTLM